MITIIVDQNESSKFKNIIKEKLVNGENLHFRIEFARLEVGDILIKKNDAVAILIERKTYTDFATSFRDRKKEQLWRLKKYRDMHVGVRVCYLIEKNSYSAGIPMSTLQQAATNIYVRDGIHIIVTSGMERTIREINRMIKCLMKYDINDECESRAESITYCFGKSASISPDVWYECMLKTLPGIGPKKALVIKNKYPRLMDLMLALKSEKFAISGFGNKKINMLTKFLI